MGIAEAEHSVAERLIVAVVQLNINVVRGGVHQDDTGLTVRWVIPVVINGKHIDIVATAMGNDSNHVTTAKVQRGVDHRVGDIAASCGYLNLVLTFTEGHKVRRIGIGETFDGELAINIDVNFANVRRGVDNTQLRLVVVRLGADYSNRECQQ